MRPRKPSKALERSAREIRDSDEFVEHIAGISALYRRELAAEDNAHQRAIAKELRAFEKKADALSVWLSEALQENRRRVEQDAFDQMGTAVRGNPHLLRTEGKELVDWLQKTAKAAAALAGERKTSRTQGERRAPRAAAEALRATFEHHKLKWSASIVRGQPSDAVKLLCAIARGAGDTLAAADARAAILDKPAVRAPK